MKTFDFKLWFAFLLIFLIPAIQNIFRIHFVGELPNEWGFNISSQIQWLGVLYEVLKEAFLIPLFFMFSKSLNKLSEHSGAGIIVMFLLYSALSFFVFIFSDEILLSLNQDINLIFQSSFYIKLESIAILFSIFVDYLIIYLATIGKFNKIIILSLIKSSLLILTDYLFISTSSLSFNFGVNGIAYSNILVNLILTIYVLTTMDMWKVVFHPKIDIKWLKEWLHLGTYSGLESLIRNAVFFVMILGMINKIGEQGSYWVANSIIWGILLAPAMALAEVVKRDIAQDPQNIIKNTKGYIILIIIFSLLWLMSLPLMNDFLVNIMKLDNAESVFYLILIQTVFYITFMFNNSIFDAAIQGLGKTKYMLYQSIIINLGYYGIIFILYKSVIIYMSLTSISIIFGCGMIIDMIPTFFLYKKAINQYGLKIRDIF